jgi:2-polyprenyl-3-methyl-5-hydroxy-6-metoxy-1,4-benzoquinol methylase
MESSGYAYSDAKANRSHAYLWGPVFQSLQCFNALRVFDLGCGSGAFANALAAKGFKMSGVDPSTSGIENARKAYPHLPLEVGSTEEDLAGRFGRFQAVTSLEVVEHVYAPRDYARRVFDLLEPDGTAIISTPYHGYLKNLALAASGGLDRHFTALWDNGHIKFWSIKTLRSLLTEAGFDRIDFQRVGRIPPLAKSMIAIARKPR